jgi:hypothetical protein
MAPGLAPRCGDDARGEHGLGTLALHELDLPVLARPVGANALRVHGEFAHLAIGAQKLTVSASGSPSRPGCSSTARSAVAAETPPKGLMKVQ